MPVQPTEPISDPLVGQLFAGRYRIRKLIARGAMGRVYFAEHETLGRPLAIKVLSLAARADTRADRERFSREASQLARLTHENTVRVYDHGVEGDLSYIVMEYVNGTTLRAMLGDGRLDPLRTIRIARQICGSLGEAHELGLVHRDLKPANVMVAQNSLGDDVVKVVDLGLVKELTDAAQMTAEGEMVGTPMFMAPEQVRGQRLDHRVDIYALGVLLYRCFTGEYPFPERGTAPVLLAHLHDPPRPFREVAPDLVLPHAIEWMVLRCMEKDPANRFANVRELVRALKLCEASLLDASTASFDGLELVQGRLVLASQSAEPPTRPPAARLQIAFVIATAASVLFFATAMGFVLVRALWGGEQPSAAVPDLPVPAPVVREIAPPPPSAPAQAAPAPIRPAPRAPSLAGAPAPPPPAEPAPATAPPRAPVVAGGDLKDPWAEPAAAQRPPSQSSEAP